MKEHSREICLAGWVWWAYCGSCESFGFGWTARSGGSSADRFGQVGLVGLVGLDDLKGLTIPRSLMVQK